MDDNQKPIESRTVTYLRAHIRQSTGKQYPLLAQELTKLSEGALQEFNRLLQDLENEKRKAENNARMMPWRR